MKAIDHKPTQAAFKVTGAGNSWHVWAWQKGERLSSWNIVAGPFLTKRKATATMKMMKATKGA